MTIIKQSETFLNLFGSIGPTGGGEGRLFLFSQDKNKNRNNQDTQLLYPISTFSCADPPTEQKNF